MSKLIITISEPIKGLVNVSAVGDLPPEIVVRGYASLFRQYPDFKNLMCIAMISANTKTDEQDGQTIVSESKN